MTIYETMFARRSVRKFLPESLPKETIQKIAEYLSEIKQIDGLKCEFAIVDSNAVIGGKAPHYILIGCPKDAQNYINVGYFLQTADLYLQNIGLGTLWLGSVFPKKGQMDDYCIMLAFGNSNVPYRVGENDFNRLPISEVANVENEVTRVARIAPSAMNSQPWKITYSANLVTVDYVPHGLVAGILKRKMSKIDMGIVTKHICLALENEGKIPQIKTHFKKPAFWTEIFF